MYPPGFDYLSNRDFKRGALSYRDPTGTFTSRSITLPNGQGRMLKAISARLSACRLGH